MCSSTTTSPTSFSLLLTDTHSLSPRRHLHLPFTSPITLLSHHSLGKPTLRLSSAIADKSSWVLPDDDATDDFGGYPTFLVAGIGTSIAVLVAALAHFSLSKNEKHQTRVVDVAVDSNQQEAMHALRKLKILDEDVKDNELCTRREYARWLVRASSLLERNPKYKIIPEVALSGSVTFAYEDVTNVDPDFESIQALAEAGVVPSKLSLKHIDGGLNFSPERILSRRDLIEWRSQLEYDLSTSRNPETDSLTVQFLKTKLDLMDARRTNSDEWPGLYMDMLAGDRSLLRRVFGQIRRLQPDKPSTIAQAAVALTSGRMIEAIQSEFLRLQEEESSRVAAKEAIRQELLDRGEIERWWAEKMEEEKKRGLKVQQLYVDAVNLLEQEKIVQEGAVNGFLKEKAAMDCQKQLLEALKEEINEISERLASERTEQSSDEEIVQTLRSDLQIKKEGILDAKSVLEAEIEALRILRSWIEDEAKKSKARSKVLEEVGRRWKWDSKK
uniref:SLH domain-containing protein n=1 Tax=Chenopodium quinoa TaxID=63459 RepID=A0A803L7A2_CHEQI